MRNISESMWNVWETGLFVGDNRPVTRATIQKAIVQQTGNFRTLAFDQLEPQYEIPNIISCNIDRRLGTDAATMTLTFSNNEPPTVDDNLDETYAGGLGPIFAVGGEAVLDAPTRRELGDLGKPGIFSYRRGVTPDSARLWGHDSDDLWVDMFIPNRLVRTFQGYGTTGTPNPWDDTNLVMTGMWLIDRVEYKSDTSATLYCRDTAKLLIEQRLYPPIIPVDKYVKEGGLRFCADYYVTETQEVVVRQPRPPNQIPPGEPKETVGDNVAEHVSSGWDSSSAPWYGYNGSVYGHRASHVFDGDESTYWLSVGNGGPNEVWSYEWIEGDCKGEPINRIKFKQKWGNYRIYVGVKEDGVWQGSKVVPYGYNSEPAYPNDSNRPYISTQTTPSGDGWVEIELDRMYEADRARITFTNLQYSGLGSYPYRAAVYEFEAFAVTGGGKGGDDPPEIEPLQVVYHFDGSGETEDPDSDWTDDENATDGSESTSATSATAGDIDTNYLHLRGTNSSTSLNLVLKVEVRVHTGAQSDVAINIHGAGWEGALGQKSWADVNGWSDYKELNVPSGGWTFEKIKNLEARLWATAEPDGADVTKVEVRVSYEDITQEIEVEVLVPGNMSDYTDIVKVLAAWSGFWWPEGSPEDIYLREFAGNIGPEATTPEMELPFPSAGRVWGDFQYSGAYPVDPPCIPPSFWDNKSVMDGINQLKEILGFICYVDSTGGIVWRMPNIWRTGNYITGTGYVGQDSVRTVSETEALVDLGVTLDDVNLRSQIIVVSADDPTFHTAIEPGWSTGEVVPTAVDKTGQNMGDLSLLGGQERILLVPNYPFISQAEVDKFAYLVSLWLHWSYRKSRFRIPGNPAFEPDDQIRIQERVTSESYIHYIQGIRSSMDMKAGTWYCDIDTHWLGAGPDAEWVINTYEDMPPALYAYLRNAGLIDDGETGLPPGWDETWEVPDFPTDPPRLDEDLDELFPDPPPIVIDVSDIPGYDDGDNIGDDWSDEDIENLPPPASGVWWRSEEWRLSYWGTPRSTDLTTIQFVTRWSSSYSLLPLADQLSMGTHPDQTSTRNTTVPSIAKGAYRLMAEILCDEKVDVFSCAAWAGYDRTIGSTGRLSAHAWGLAIDINPSNFPYCSRGAACYDVGWVRAKPDGSQFITAAQRIVTQIRTNSGSQVFGWGGYWTSAHDWMHFEIVTTPGHLASGVRR